MLSWQQTKCQKSSLLLIWAVCISKLLLHNKPFFFFFLILYWGIVDLQCCVNFCYIAKWFSYTQICFIFKSFFFMLYHRILNIVPVIYCRTLLFIHAKYNNLYLLILNFQSIPPTLPLPWQLPVCSLCLWVCFPFRDKDICYVCVIF